MATQVVPMDCLLSSATWIGGISTVTNLIFMILFIIRPPASIKSHILRILRKLCLFSFRGYQILSTFVNFLFALTQFIAAPVWIPNSSTIKSSNKFSFSTEMVPIISLFRVELDTNIQLLYFLSLKILYSWCFPLSSVFDTQLCASETNYETIPIQFHSVPIYGRWFRILSISQFFGFFISSSFSFPLFLPFISSNQRRNSERLFTINMPITSERISALITS